jgi:glucose dehydrogenase
MKIGSTVFLACVLVASSVLCSQWERFFEWGSLTSSLSMLTLVAVDFLLIFRFFKHQQSAQVKMTTQLVSVISSIGAVLFCLIQAIIG